MNIAVITNDALRQELTAQMAPGNADGITWLHSPALVPGAEAYIDLLFENNPAHKDLLKNLRPSLIIVNAVGQTLSKLPQGFVRFNGWPTFLQRKITEAASNDADKKRRTEEIFLGLGKQINWVPDAAGFIAARITSLVINEAYLALEENFSSKEDIDTAMKLGSGSPWGPFEWATRIGLKNILSLLTQMEQENPGYRPSALLQKSIPHEPDTHH